ncbi:hypothetical protein BJ741DRAFT_706016 [Chytriomyces cf. hyalinus JEL632]|nr:hypothetical protein BJ741DRAFT_706016 [Chytriomyces cf. hyalinus JEL632]
MSELIRITTSEHELDLDRTKAEFLGPGGVNLLILDNEYTRRQTATGYSRFSPTPTPPLKMTATCSFDAAVSNIADANTWTHQLITPFYAHYSQVMPLIQALPFPPPPPPQQQQQHQQLFLKGPGGVNLLDSPACAASQIVDALIPIDRLLCELVLPVDTAARPPPFVVRVSLPAASTPSSGPSSSPTTPQLATYQQLIYQQPSAHPTTESTDNTTPPIQNRYPCPFFECAKAFKTAWHRSSHMKLHTTTRDFPCSQCAMTFARRHDVLRHERTVHSRATVKDITCRCGKTFGRIDSLRRHQKMICVLTSKVHAAAESTIHIHNDSKTGLSESDLESRRALLLTHSNQLLDLLVTLAGFAISSVGVTTFLMSAVGFFTPLILASYFMHFAWLAMLTQ